MKYILSILLVLLAFTTYSQVGGNGDVFDVSIPVKNNGTGVATNVVLSVDYTSGVTPISAETSSGYYNFTFDEWVIRRISPGDSALLTLSFEVDSVENAPFVVNASVASDMTDNDTTNNVFTDTINVLWELVDATAVPFDYSCMCGSVADNDIECNYCTTKYSVVPGSSVNGSLLYFDTLSGNFRFEVQDPNLESSFDYTIICFDCGDDTDHVQNTVTHTIPRLFVKPLGSGGGGSDSEMFYIGVDKDTIYHVASLDTTPVPLDNGTIDSIGIVETMLGSSTNYQITLFQRNGNNITFEITDDNNSTSTASLEVASEDFLGNPSATESLILRNSGMVGGYLVPLDSIYSGSFVTSISFNTDTTILSTFDFLDENKLAIGASIPVPHYKDVLDSMITGVAVTEIDTVTKRLAIYLSNGDSLTSVFTDYRGGAGTGDDWGAQVVQSDTTLKGIGTVPSPLGIDFSKVKLSQFVDDYDDDNGIYSGIGTLSGLTQVTTLGNNVTFTNPPEVVDIITNGSNTGIQVQYDNFPVGNKTVRYTYDGITHTDMFGGYLELSSGSGIRIGLSGSENIIQNSLFTEYGLIYNNFADFTSLQSNSLIPKQMLDDSISAVMDSINALVVDNNTLYTTDDTLTGNRLVEQNGNILKLNGGSFISTGAVGTTDVTGAGTRMMWLPSKYAFLAGRVDSDIWDADSIGTGAVAFGLENIAKGDWSLSSGYYNINKQELGFTHGTLNEARTSGLGNILFGEGNIGTGTYGFASGSYNEVSGGNATALGSNLYARSFSEVSIGLFGVDYTPTSTSSFDESDRIFSIANGISSDRSNALIVYKGNQGDTRVHFNPYQDNTIPDVTVEITGELRVDSLVRVATKLIGADSSNVFTEMNISPNLSISGGVLDINTDSILTKTEGENSFVSVDDTTYVKDTELDSFYTKGETDATFSTKAYTDQAEQDAKDYADVNDSDNQTLTIDSVGRVFEVGISGENSIKFTDENTQLTDEEVQDITGDMFSSNTETRIIATYNDITGKLDLIVDPDLNNYDNSTTQFLQESDVSSLRDSVTSYNTRINQLELVPSNYVLGGTIVDCGIAIGDSTSTKQVGFVVPYDGRIQSFTYAFCDVPAGIGNETVDSVRVNLVLYDKANNFYTDGVGPETSGVSIVAYGSGSAQYKKELILAAPQAVEAGDVIKFEVTKSDGTPLDASVTIEGLYASTVIQITSDGQTNTAAATQP